MPVQSEAALENGLIDTLQKMNYEYVHIEEEKNLSANFKKQLSDLHSTVQPTICWSSFF